MRQQTKYNRCPGTKKGAARLAILCLLTIAATPGFANPATGAEISEAQANSLGAGGYLWDPSLAPQGRTVMVVKLDTQRAFVWRNGKLIGISMIASGKPGYETPDGTFTVLEKQKDHHSNKYDDAPMPYMQRLTWSGLALHGGSPRGYPASHGCVRLPMGFAAALFKENTRGMTVVITGQAPGQQNTTVASRGSTRRNAPSNDTENTSDLQAAKYGSDADAPATPAVGADPAVQSAPENSGQANGSADGSDGNQNLPQAQSGQRDNTGNEQSPEELPPPPN
ncbi:MAG TPA: L,D-transpeptidase family protein [Rhizomicrobium sp.]|jgi:hypothetical protein|nr:L,D-transpeptidase family protein [Rhizomicrobium sp.]